MREITRRHLLQAVAAVAISKAGGAEAVASVRRPNETQSGVKIELYTNTLSAMAGETVTVHVSTTARLFNLQIARVGTEETVVWTRDDIRGTFHPTPDDAWEKGCRWPASVQLVIPATWKSGYYQIKAVTADTGAPRGESFAFVVVRAAQPTSKVLLVLATNTYGAYNNHGGANFYLRASTGRGTGPGFDGGEHKVSFQRPWIPGFLWKPESYRFGVEINDYQNIDFTKVDPTEVDRRMVNEKSGLGLWSLFAGFHNWERVMVRWLEQNGYDVDYAISSDLEFHPDLLARYRLMLSVGHDEYWSWGMRDTVESFIARGGNVCFFSGNVCFWQVRYEDHGSSMVCYKHDYQEDPYFKAGKKQLTATSWSNHHIARPETRMTGLSTLYAGYARFMATLQGAGGYLVYRPEHWVFKDSGMAYGDCLGQGSTIVHYEVDGCPIRMEGGLPYPDSDYDGPPSLEILGMVPAAMPAVFSKPDLAKEIFGNTNPKATERVIGNRNHAVMSIYTNNGTVFSSGTTDWTSGLTGQDPAVERVTKNLLDRLSA